MGVYDMERSLCAYLQRQSTEKPVCFLQDCLSGDVVEDYTDEIPVVVEILARRAQQEEN